MLFEKPKENTRTTPVPGTNGRSESSEPSGTGPPSENVEPRPQKADRKELGPERMQD